MKSLATLILLAGLTGSLLADDAVTAPSTKDLSTLSKTVDAQKIAKAQATAPVVNISGYADTSYTKVLTGSSNAVTGPTCTKSGSLTTEKVSLNVTLPNQNGWFAGVQVDVIHTSSK